MEDIEEKDWKKEFKRQSDNVSYTYRRKSFVCYLCVDVWIYEG